MNKIAVIFVFLTLIICTSGSVLAEQNSNSANSNTTVLDGPELVLAQVFEFLQNGKTDEATALFAINTPEQEKYVHRYVKGGAAFFASNSHIKNQVIETFSNGKLALCVIEQTSSEQSDKWELEKGFLVLENGQWLLLPIQMDYRSYKNELSSADVSAFASLVNDFSAFRRNYK